MLHLKYLYICRYFLYFYIFVLKEKRGFKKLKEVIDDNLQLVELLLYRNVNNYTYLVSLITIGLVLEDINIRILELLGSTSVTFGTSDSPKFTLSIDAIVLSVDVNCQSAKTVDFEVNQSKRRIRINAGWLNRHVLEKNVCCC